MPRKSEIVRLAEAEISKREINIRKLSEQIFKQQAEVKAYKDMIEWSNNATKRRSSTNK